MNKTLKWSIILTLLTLVIIPYNVWLVSQLFDLRGRLSVIEGNNAEQVLWMRESDEKQDTIAENVAFIRGKIEGM